VSGVPMGVCGGNEDQLTAVQLTPAADIAIAELEEKNRPVKIVAPTCRRDRSLAGVDLYEGFWTIDARSQDAIYANYAYETITGRSLQSLKENPSSYKELIHPDDRAHVLAKLDEATRNWRFDEKFRIVRPEGEVRWVWVRGFPVRDTAGAIMRLVGTALEITAEKEAEARVAENLALAKSAWAEADALHKATMGLTQDLRVDFVLDALLQSLADLIPYTCARVLIPEGGPHVLALREKRFPPVPIRPQKRKPATLRQE
jgi:PAS domain S-box-containing protein